jgi:hypothetical protein
METLSIYRDINFSEIEKAFEVVLASKDIKLRLPNTLKERGAFGMEGLVSQLLATWLNNKTYEHIFHSYGDANDQESFNDLGSSFYGMIALKQSSKILSADLIPVDSDFTLKSSYERVRQVIKGSFQDAYKGFYVAIPSIKSKGINREYNCPFYLGDKVVSKDEFRRIVGAVIEGIIPLKSRKDYIEKYLDHVSEMIRELFDNTHKHGRTDHSRNTLPTNFRAVIFNSVDFTEHRLIELLNGRVEGMLGFVLECQAWMETHKKNLPILDITVVDAGSGYARKWTGKSKEQLTFDEEVEAVYSCFQKNNTSNDNNADGSGLTHILKDLSKVRGWFRLRTGSVAVSKSFFLGTESSEIKRSDIKHAGAFIEGTSFNIVLPLVNISGGDF